MNLPKLDHEISILVAALWNFDVLQRFVPALKKSITLDTKLFIALNDADQDSINYLYSEGIDFLVVRENYGTQIVDALMPLCKSEYWIWMNTDMYLSKGFDADLKDWIKSRYPCAAQPRGVERRTTTDNIVYGDTSLPEWMDETAYETFQRNVDLGKYSWPATHGLFHPIAARSLDVQRVGGFGSGMDMAFFPGHSADSMFAYNLYQMDPGYEFIISDKSFHYHAGSITNKRVKEVAPEVDNRHNSEEFNKRAGMTQKEFHKLIRYGELI